MEELTAYNEPKSARRRESSIKDVARCFRNISNHTRFGAIEGSQVTVRPVTPRTNIAWLENSAAIHLHGTLIHKGGRPSP